MTILWRRWIRFCLAASLIAGCNTLLPGLAAADAGMAVAQDQACHHPGDKGGPPSATCKASCLAVAPAFAGVAARPCVKPPVQIIAPAAMASRTSAPEPPPPRTAPVKWQFP